MECTGSRWETARIICRPLMQVVPGCRFAIELRFATGKSSCQDFVLQRLFSSGEDVRNIGWPDEEVVRPPWIECERRRCVFIVAKQTDLIGDVLDLALGELRDPKSRISKAERIQVEMKPVVDAQIADGLHTRS